MSKKSKGYVKVKALKGTIFDKKKWDDPIVRQRRMGFWSQHGINPMAVARTSIDHTAVESIGDGMARVYYFAIYIPEDWKPVSAKAVPPGVWCEHGGYKKRHTVTQIKSVTVPLVEVLA